MANNQFINLEELSKTTQALLSKINEQSNLKVNKTNVRSELNEGIKIGSIEGINFYVPETDTSNFVTYNNLAPVAITGRYNDLKNKPTLATVATSGSYNDLKNRPSFATVATSGSYNDLSNKPLLPFIIIDEKSPSSEIYPAHLSNENNLSSFPVDHSGQNLWTYFYFYLTTDITLAKAQTSFSIKINDTNYDVIRYTKQGTPYVANSLDYSITLVKGVHLGRIGSEVGHYYLYIYEST